MPYSSSPKYQNREEIDNAEDVPRDAYHYDYARPADYSYHGQASVPRSCSLVEHDLRVLVEDGDLIPFYTTDPTAGKYKHQWPAHGHSKTGPEGLISGMESLLLGDSKYTTMSTPRGSRDRSPLKENHAKAPAVIASSNKNVASVEIHSILGTGYLENARKQEQLETQIQERVYEYKQSFGVDDNVAIKTSNGPRNDDHLQPLEDDRGPFVESVQPTTLVNKLSTDLDDQIPTFISRLLKDLVYRSSCFRGIGSWVFPAQLLGQHGEPTQPIEIDYPDMASFHRDVVLSGDQSENGNFSQCAGNRESRPTSTGRQTSLSTQKPGKVGKATNNRSKGKKKQSSNDGDEDGEEQGEEQNDTVVSKKNFNLVCPFFKRHPQIFRSNQGDNKYRTCGTTTFPDITRLKEHLYRVHKQPETCPRCQETFDDRSLLGSHLLENERCPELPKEELIVLTPDVEKRLRRKTLVPDPLEKWREIFAIIFPGATIQSPTQEEPPEAHSPGAKDDASFISMLSREMPELLHSELDEIFCKLGFNDTQTSILKEKILPTVGNCQIKLWERYQQQQPDRVAQSSGIGEGASEFESAYFNLAETPGMNPGLMNDTVTPTSSQSTKNHTFGMTHESQARFPQTPLNFRPSTLIGTPNIYEPAVLSTESWKSDSGYGTALHCGKSLCDDSSCVSCLNMVKSPTLRKGQLPTQSVPNPFTASAEGTNFGAPPSDSSTGLALPFNHWPPSGASNGAPHQVYDYDDNEPSYYF